MTSAAQSDPSKESHWPMWPINCRPQQTIADYIWACWCFSVLAESGTQRGHSYSSPREPCMQWETPRNVMYSLSVAGLEEMGLASNTPEGPKITNLYLPFSSWRAFSITWGDSWGSRDCKTGTGKNAAKPLTTGWKESKLELLVHLGAWSIFNLLCILLVKY